MSPPLETKNDPDLPPPSSLLGLDKKGTDPETNATKLKYPKAVFFIVSNEFCERFCFYGMRTILALYLSQSLGYSTDTATVVYHAFVSFAYLTPLLGAMIADSWLGRFNTIFFLSIIYAVGSIILSMAAMPGVLPAEAFTYVGLILIGFGTGGIKPCVSSFGGDQFVVPEQERQLQQFFSVFYFAVNGGSLLSTFITPILREDVDCFGEDGCYSLAFGVPACLMIVSIVIFVAGRPLYKIKQPEGNVVLKVSKCITRAISLKFNSKGVKKDHWLDYAEEEFGRKMVEDVKSTLRVLWLFLPLPIFWALFDQQGSRWTFQATRMNGDMGGGFTIKPDQIQVFNPALVMILIPIFEAGLYPLFKKLNILQKPLHKMTFGGSLAALAFVISALVELAITPTLAVIPGSGEAQLRIFNSMECPMIVTFNGIPEITEEQTIKALDMYEKTLLKAKGTMKFDMNIRQTLECSSTFASVDVAAEYKEGQAKSYVITDNNVALIETTGPYSEDLEKSNKGNAKVRVLFNLDSALARTVIFKRGSLETAFALIDEDGKEDGKTNVTELDIGNYRVSIGEQELEQSIYLGAGGVYSYIVQEKAADEFDGSLVEVTQPNTVNILWQIPQYIIITSGEVMFSITGLEFAFTQAPLSMKSVVTAGWLLTVAFGNIIVIIIAEAKFVDDPMWEFVLFAVLMALFMVIFFIMTLGYKYVTVASEDTKDIALEKKEKSSHENGAFDDHKD